MATKKSRRAPPRITYNIVLPKEHVDVVWPRSKDKDLRDFFHITTKYSVDHETFTVSGAPDDAYLAKNYIMWLQRDMCPRPKALSTPEQPTAHSK